MSKFAVLFRCKHVPDFRGDTMTPGGTYAWLVDNEGYWQGDTFGGFRNTSRAHIPGNVVMFETREEAEKKWPPFMRGECGIEIGPWWIKPDGWYEIVELKQKFKTVPDGYEAVK
jgi:hypothetical protein